MVKSIRIAHLAIWTKQIEVIAGFYQAWFDVRVSPVYINEKKGFRSVFLSFTDGPSIELMDSIHLKDRVRNLDIPMPGYAHVAISVGTQQDVDAFALRLGNAGVPILDGPRQTGDGYYEAVITDPDGNRIELIASIPS